MDGARSSSQARREIDALYREHAPRIAAALARAFGAARLDIIENAIHEAFAAAITQWPIDPPANPVGWLHTTAKRRVIDAVRAAAWLVPDDQLAVTPTTDSDSFDDGDLLKMMLVCCHPVLSVEASVALALRTLCGFPIPALARALLADEAAIEKRLARARQALRDARIDFEPTGDLAPRLESVHRTLYVLFFEGYSAHAGAAQVDRELCDTAIRLTEQLLVNYPSPQLHALAALLLLQGSRLATRVDQAGEIVPLADQDRARWDRAMIDRGLVHLAEAAVGDALSPFHLEAAIAACHALAPTYRDTDWQQIVALYDKLLVVQPSPVIALHRAIALGRADGPRAGLRALAAIGDAARLDDHPVHAAAAADLKAQLGDAPGARAAYRRALELATTEPERRFLAKKLAELSSAGSPTKPP